MSTVQRKRRGRAVDSRRAPKRRRLLASSAGGPSEPEPIEAREGVVEVIEHTGETSEPEVRDLTNADLVVHQEHSQQHPDVSGEADNPSVILISEDEEEPMDIVGVWPVNPFRSVIVVDENSEQWQHNQHHPQFYPAADNSVVPLMGASEEEQGDYDDVWPVNPFRSVIVVDENSEPLEEYEQERRNAILRSQQLSDNSVLSGNDEDEATDNDVALSGGTIRCPICMDFYSEIVQSKRLVVSTLCGHVFCSRCLPVALETASTCPTCRTELTREQYHPIYI